MIALLLLAHSFYAPECCEGRHCRAVPCAEITDAGRFWHWWSYEFLKSAGRVSPDGRCHVCVTEGAAICIYLPGEVS